MVELEAEPTSEELSKAIDSLACGKAPGIDGIPPDLIKRCKTTLMQPLHDVLCQHWREGSVLQDMRDAKIVTLDKNKACLWDIDQNGYLHTRADGRLLNLARLRAKTTVRETLIRDMLFADDAAVMSHTEQQLQCLMDRFSQACKDFGLTTSLKKTNVLGQDVDTPPVITIDNYQLDVVHQFTYLGSTISDNLSLDVEIN
ncbi:hypothetical protein ACOMHN_047345 [Nucella lapillus]